MMFREIGKGFGNAIQDMGRRAFKFAAPPLDFLHDFAPRGIPASFR